MKTPTYHVGWYLRKTTAVFQYVREKDSLNCEIVCYLGLRETTKAAARERLKATKSQVVSCLGELYPSKVIRNAVII